MKIDPVETTIAEAVRRAWNGATDTGEAVAALLVQMRRDPELYRSLMEPHEYRVAATAIGQFRVQLRRDIWSRPEAPDQRVAALARVNRETFYDFPLPDGRRLGDALRDDVLWAADDYRKREKVNRDRAVFLERVAERLPEGVRVRDALSVSDLQEIQHG